MTISGSSVVIFALFGVLVAALMLAAIYMLYDRVAGMIERFWLRSPVRGGLGVLRNRFHRIDDSSEGESDDLDESTAALISMLKVASIVVDESDGVVRANPAAYTLGIVGDDVIVNGRVLEAIHEVRRRGGRAHLDLTTDTPDRFATARPEGSSTVVDRNGTRVSRPNWLKVTVGRLNGRSVVVLIDDVSDAIRFAQTRDSFIANVSEQLLAPSKELELLADALERDDLDLAQVRAKARQVRRSSRYMSHMVADLLLLIKAQEPVVPSPVNRLSVRAQLDWVCDQLHEESQRLGVPLVVACDEGLEINADAEQIRAALRKLVENALTYSPRGASVSLTAALSRERRDVVIRVIDRGSGIAKAEQPRVFERFYRGSSQNDNTREGIGLGLAIVKHVALTHHGTVSLWSASGQGCTFSMVLPLAQE